MHARIKLEGNRVKWFETRRCNIMADIFHLHPVMIINRTEVKINISYASILFYGEMGKRGETWLWHDILFKDDGDIKENGTSAKYSFESFIYMEGRNVDIYSHSVYHVVCSACEYTYEVAELNFK